MYFIKLTSPVATEKIALIAKNLSPALNVKPQEIERALAKVIGKIAKVNRLNKAERIADIFRNEGVKVTVIEYSKKSSINIPRNFRIESESSQKSKAKLWHKIVRTHFAKQLSLNACRKRKVFTSYIHNPSLYQHRTNQSVASTLPFAQMLKWGPVIIVSIFYISLLSIIFNEENRRTKEQTLQTAQGQKQLASILKLKVPLLATSISSDLLAQNKDLENTLADSQVFTNIKSDQFLISLKKVDCDQQAIYSIVQKGSHALHDFARARFKELVSNNPKLPMMQSSINTYIPPALKPTNNSNVTSSSCLKQALLDEILPNSEFD